MELLLEEKKKEIAPLVERVLKENEKRLKEEEEKFEERQVLLRMCVCVCCKRAQWV